MIDVEVARPDAKALLLAEVGLSPQSESFSS
jgi:hypothetical protein